jgi:hypothetical protein
MENKMKAQILLALAVSLLIFALPVSAQNPPKYEIGSLLGNQVQPDGTYSSNIYCGDGTFYTCTGSAGFNTIRIYDVQTDDGTWHLVTDREAGDSTVRQLGQTPMHFKSEKPNLLDALKTGDKVVFRTEKDRRIGAKGQFHVFIPRADDPTKEEKFEGWFTPKNLPVAPPKPTDNIKAMCDAHRFSADDEKKYCTQPTNQPTDVVPPVEKTNQPPVEKTNQSTDGKSAPPVEKYQPTAQSLSDPRTEQFRKMCNSDIFLPGRDDFSIKLCGITFPTKP